MRVSTFRFGWCLVRHAATQVAWVRARALPRVAIRIVCCILSPLFTAVRSEGVLGLEDARGR